VWRFAILYFTMFILFIVLLVGPIIAGKFLDLSSFGSSLPKELYQESYDNNDTLGTTMTGTGAIGGTTATATAAARRVVRLF
jgi:1,3-beta-glucan synthase